MSFRRDALEHQLLRLLDLQPSTQEGELIEVDAIMRLLGTKCDIKILHNTESTQELVFLQELCSYFREKDYLVDINMYPKHQLLEPKTFTSVDNASCLLVYLSRSLVEKLVHPEDSLSQDRVLSQVLHGIFHKSLKKILLLASPEDAGYILQHQKQLNSVLCPSSQRSHGHVADQILYLDSLSPSDAFSALLPKVALAIWRPIRHLVNEECSKHSISFSSAERDAHRACTEEVGEEKGKGLLLTYWKDLAHALRSSSLHYHAHVYLVKIKACLQDDESSSAHDRLHGEFMLGTGRYEIGRHDEAIKLLELCLRLSAEIHGDRSLYSVCIVGVLAEIYMAKGESLKGALLLQGSLQTLQLLLIPSNDELYLHILSLYVACLSLSHQAHYAKKGVEGLWEALRAEAPLPSCADPSFFSFRRGFALQNLAIFYFFNGQFKDAEHNLSKAYKICRGEGGEYHRDALMVQHNHAVLLETQAQYFRAEKEYKDCLEKISIVLGDAHPSTLTVQHSLAVFYYAQYHYDQALPLFEACLQRRKAVLGAYNPDTVASMNNYANCLASVHRVDEAVGLYRLCLDREDSTLGKKEGDFVITLYNLGCCHYDQNRLEEAREIFEKCLPLLKNMFGERNVHSVQAQEKLTIIVKRQGRENSHSFNNSAHQGDVVSNHAENAL